MVSTVWSVWCRVYTIHSIGARESESESESEREREGRLQLEVDVFGVDVFQGGGVSGHHTPFALHPEHPLPPFVALLYRR